ncbi:von Willebrand factor type A domain protein [Rosistilla carotiformis]|uniref:von Willebrand factor type A domain protein n=1 Tax=Rosistilla carotiformis TaxID=2528017 RepID=A0A518JTT1_9BACT|nr:VWA domain-containing protein [Rosistilla carotiformis]QDV68962.1 von Willebrand factor type A domain protein [Rosistilla carotiformis]
MCSSRSNWRIVTYVTLLLLLLPNLSFAQEAVSYEQLLNKVKAGVDDATLIRQIEESPIVYVVDLAQIEELRKAGASEAVIAAFQQDRVRSKDVITDFILIFDCSNSMNEPARNGQSKMEVAKTTVAELIDMIPIGMPTSVIVYGHNVEEKCEAVMIGRPLTPLGGADKAELRQFVLGLQPRGWTPIAKSLRVAGEVLDSKMDAYTGIVLISDGKETCGGDPAAEARKLAAKHNIEFHVVGFDVDDDTRRQLENIARLGGGKYQGASSPEDLKGALKSVTDQINEAQQRLKDLAKQKEAELAAQRARAAELDKQLADRERQRQEAQALADRLANEKDLASEKLQDMERSLADRMKEIGDLNKAADAAAAALESAKKAHVDLQAEHKNALADAGQKQDALREKLDDRMKEIAALNQAADAAAAALDAAKKQQRDLQAEHAKALAEAEKQKDALRDKAAETAKQLAESMKNAKDLADQNARLADTQRAAEADRDRIAAALDAERKKGAALAADLAKSAQDLAALQREADRAARQATDQLAAAERMKKSLADQLDRSNENAKNDAKRLAALRDAANDRADALAAELAEQGRRYDRELSDAEGRINELASMKADVERQLADLLAQQEHAKNRPYDLASIDRGGRVVDAPSQLDDRQHGVQNLLRDGGIYRVPGRNPVSIVLAF